MLFIDFSLLCFKILVFVLFLYSVIHKKLKGSYIDYYMAVSFLYLVSMFHHARNSVQSKANFGKEGKLAVSVWNLLVRGQKL